jgi:A/G-specific adenine glycosylase
VLVIAHAGAILLEKRPPVGIWGGLWSLPEMPVEGDVEEYLRQRFGVAASDHLDLPPITHGFTHFTLTLHPQRVRVARWPRTADEPGILWLSPSDARHAALPAPIRKLVQSLSMTDASMSK